MIQKYTTNDLHMWKEWLVYGTALGAGEKVTEAMSDLNISIPEAVAIHSMHSIIDHAYSSSTPLSSGSGHGGGGRGGGGFGRGGGGGGGGGGAR